MGLPAAGLRALTLLAMNKLMSCIAAAGLLLSLPHDAWAQLPKDSLLYGAAYYEEYEPTDRLAADVAMMKAAGINVVRIGESTWATMEPRDGVFDFSHIDRVIKAMNDAGIHVIVGTPTYAVPSWLAREHPDVLATTPSGVNRYGTRQNMDITDAHFRFYAERVIRRMVEHVKDQPAVIGYQLDNETKSYHVSGAEVQRGFVHYLQKRFSSLAALNLAFGLDYWSNRVNDWEDFPSVDGAVNPSLTCAFAEYQRQLVTDYLAWQAGLVKSIKRPEQFLTQNFDMDWRGYSYGIQPEVDHFAAARVLDVAGIDIYHPTQRPFDGHGNCIWRRSGAFDARWAELFGD